MGLLHLIREKSLFGQLALPLIVSDMSIFQLECGAQQKHLLQYGKQLYNEGIIILSQGQKYRQLQFFSLLQQLGSIHQYSSAEGESVDEEDSDSCTNNDYSFRRHLQVNISDKPMHDQLVHEILKYNGGSCIHYTQKSNHRGALFRVPSMSSSKQYCDHLGRKHNFMEKKYLFYGGIYE
jgi:hypothetical protein